MNVTATGIAVALAVIVAFGLLVFGPGMFNPMSQDMATVPMNGNTDSNMMPLPEELPTELTVIDEVVGEGDVVVPGSSVAVLYTGMLSDGTVFDASVRHGNEPFTFVVGQDAVIEGWHQGLVGMKEGGKRRLIIPAALGYGERGQGPIPPNATLIFDIELLEVQ